MDVTGIMHYIKRSVFAIVLLVLLVKCLSLTINAETVSEPPNICDEFLLYKMGDADFDNSITAADFGCEIRFCFFDAEEIGYYGAEQYCWYIKQVSKNSAASIKRHKYIINLDMTGKPNNNKDYYLCVSTEPVSDRYEYRKATSNQTSDAIVAAKAIIGSCTETDFYCPVSAGKHDLVPFREHGLTGATISWREKADTDNDCDYNLIPPTIIHTAADTVENINLVSLYKTTRLVNYSVANILYSYYCS